VASSDKLFGPVAMRCLRVVSNGWFCSAVAVKSLTNDFRLWGKNKSTAVMSMDDQLVPYIPNTWMWLVDESVLGLLSFEDVESQESTEG
jgi:hypothetical protein